MAETYKDTSGKTYTHYPTYAETSRQQNPYLSSTAPMLIPDYSEQEIRENAAVNAAIMLAGYQQEITKGTSPTTPQMIQAGSKISNLLSYSQKPTRQQQIYSQTITSSKLTPISTQKQLTEQRQQYTGLALVPKQAFPRISPWEATKEFASRIYHGNKDVFFPFSQVGGIVGEEKEMEIYPGRTKRGTIAPDESAFYTFGDIQKQIQTKRTANILAIETPFVQKISAKQSEIQGRINIGDISLESGQNELNTFVSELTPSYQEKISKVSQKYPDIISPESYYKRTGAEIPKYAGIGLDIGVATGLTLATIAVPAFATTAVQIGTGYFTGKGIYYQSKKPDVDVALHDIQSSLKFEGGRIVSEETPLMKEYQGYRSTAFTNLLAGATYGIGGAISAAKDVRVEELLQYKQTPYTFGGVEAIKTDEVRLIKISLSKTTGVASGETEVFLPIRLTNKGYQIESGFGVENFRYADFLKRGSVQAGDDISSSIVNFRVSSKGFFPSAAPQITGKVAGIGVKQSLGGGVSGSYADYFYFETGKGVSFMQEGESILKILPSQVRRGATGGIAIDAGATYKIAAGDVSKIVIKPATKEGLPLYNIFGKRLTTKAIQFKPTAVGEIKKSLADYSLGITATAKGYELPGGLAAQQFQTLTVKDIAPQVLSVAKQASISSVSAVETLVPRTFTPTVFGAGQSLATSVKQTSQQFSIPMLKTQQLVKTSQKTDLAFNIPYLQTTIISRTGQRNIPVAIPMEKSVLRELTKLQRVSVPAFGLTGSGFTGFGLTGPGFTGVPPFVPSMPKLFDYGRKSKGGGRKFKGRYAPSVAAIGLGIKAFKIPKSYKAGFGSLAIRPLIVSKSKKSKRRKK